MTKERYLMKAVYLAQIEENYLREYDFFPICVSLSDSINECISIAERYASCHDIAKGIDVIDFSVYAREWLWKRFVKSGDDIRISELSYKFLFTTGFDSESAFYAMSKDISLEDYSRWMAITEKMQWCISYEDYTELMKLVAIDFDNITKDDVPILLRALLGMREKELKGGR